VNGGLADGTGRGRVRGYGSARKCYSATTRIEPRDFARSGCYKDAGRKERKTAETEQPNRNQKTLTAENGKNAEIAAATGKAQKMLWAQVQTALQHVPCIAGLLPSDGGWRPLRG